MTKILRAAVAAIVFLMSGPLRADAPSTQKAAAKPVVTRVVRLEISGVPAPQPLVRSTQCRSGNIVRKVFKEDVRAGLRRRVLRTPHALQAV